MYTRVLVPVDGSAEAEAILPFVEKLAGPLDGEILLLRVVDQVTTTEPKGYLAALADRLRRKGLRVETGLRFGPLPGREIVAAAGEHGADLVAMTTHGRGGLGRALFGSVAEWVLRAASVPVLMIRAAAAQRATPTPADTAADGYHRVLIPLDGSGEAETILPFAEKLAGPLDAEVLLLRVVEPLSAVAGLGSGGIMGPDALLLRQVEAKKYLGDVAERLSQKGLRVRTLLGLGSPASQIGATAEAAGVDLIAMTTHGRSGLERVVFGSVAREVLKAAPAPVLMIRMPARAATPAAEAHRP